MLRGEVITVPLTCSSQFQWKLLADVLGLVTLSSVKTGHTPSFQMPVEQWSGSCRESNSMELVNHTKCTSVNGEVSTSTTVGDYLTVSAE